MKSVISKNKIICLCLITFISQVLHAQELKMRKKMRGDFFEEYYSLKEDKKIKHGQYIKKKKDIFDHMTFVEIGHFDNNQKNGDWYYFHANSLENYLKSTGGYSKGRKMGLWKYLYRPKRDENVISIFTQSPKVKLIPIENSSQMYEVSINTEGQYFNSRGMFYNGNKIGAWEYYNADGQLVQKYNHTENQMIENYLSDSTQRILPFFGGPSRFSRLYHTTNREVNANLYTVDSEALIQIILLTGASMLLVLDIR